MRNIPLMLEGRWVEVDKRSRYGANVVIGFIGIIGGKNAIDAPRCS